MCLLRVTHVKIYISRWGIRCCRWEIPGYPPSLQNTDIYTKGLAHYFLSILNVVTNFVPELLLSFFKDLCVLNFHSFRPSRVIQLITWCVLSKCTPNVYTSHQKWAWSVFCVCSCSQSWIVWALKTGGRSTTSPHSTCSPTSSTWVTLHVLVFLWSTTFFSKQTGSKCWMFCGVCWQPTG